ncbi:MAG: hypothetical protein ABI574_05840 [Burkholderiales bacterium]
MKTFSSTHAMEAAVAAIKEVQPGRQDDDPSFGPRVVPGELRGWLARLRLLQGVPFSYLVPDAELLPRESIRFFYLDRAWTDALVQGALSVGTVNSSDRAELAALYARVRDEVDEEERRVRLPGGEKVQQGAAGAVSGFVLRSRAVSGWPGLHVRAYDRELGGPDAAQIPESDPRRMKLLRMERLAPAVMLVLFDGVPAVVHIEEPRQGIQFGVRLKPMSTGTGTDPNNLQALTKPRNALTGEDVNTNDNDMVAVPCRPGTPGVLDIAKLNEALRVRADTHMGAAVDSAEFALQMLRFPYRQVFGDPSVNASPPMVDVFRPTISLKVLKQSFLQS